MDTFMALVLDQLRGVPAVTHRRMFGGWGLYAGGIFFAIVSDGRLYFKTDEDSRPAYLARGMGPFTYGQDHSLKTYWEVPPDVLEDAQELARWATAAGAAALAARTRRR
jgi:DNA transformation protein